MVQLDTMYVVVVQLNHNYNLYISYTITIYSTMMYNVLINCNLHTSIYI